MSQQMTKPELKKGFKGSAENDPRNETIFHSSIYKSEDFDPSRCI